MRKKQGIRLIAAVTSLSMAFSGLAYAGQWQQQGNQWQYEDEKEGKLKSTWMKTADGMWYRFDANGFMQTGWFLDSNEKWYYLNQDGSLAMGWVQVDNKWYYLNMPNGELLVDTVTPDGYPVDANGMWTGESENSVPLSSAPGGSSSSGGSSDSGSSNSGSSNSGSSNSGSNNNGNNSNSGNNSGNENNSGSENSGNSNENSGNENGGNGNESGGNESETPLKEVPEYIGFLDAVSGATTIQVVDQKSYTTGESGEIELGYTGNTEYYTQLQSVEVSRDGEIVRIYADDDWNGSYILTLNPFDTAGQYKVQLRADGYKNKVLTASVSDDGGQNETNTIFNTQKSNLYSIEQVHYGVLTFAAGSLDDYDILLNGIPAAPTAVNDQKTVVKLELNPNEVAEVTAVSRTDSTRQETISLGSGTKAFTAPIVGESPQYVLASGPISVFDYYLPNYDNDGNVRVYPTKSTYDTVAEGTVPVDDTVPQLSCPVTKLGNDIEITFDVTEESALWQRGIYEVQKDYDSGAGSRQPLSYTVTNGRIVIDADSTPIQGRNEKHTIIIKSNGYNDAKIVVELVKPAGELVLSGNFNFWAGQDLLFELTDFNYAIVNPIYAVYLDGQLLTGDCVHYHIVSSLVRLENSAHSLLTEGSHTLMVKAVGYEDYTKTFILNAPLAGQENPTMGESDAADSAFSVYSTLNIPDDQVTQSVRNTQTVQTAQTYAGLDGMSRATSGSSSGGSEGGSVNIRGTIVFEFDLVANARILAALGMDTGYSREVLSWWGSLDKDGIFYQDGLNKIIDYTYYKNHCGMPSGADDYLTLHELYISVPEAPENIFTEKAHEALYLGGAEQVKNMLEDGLLGDLYYFRNATGKPVPEITIEQAYTGRDVILKYSDIENVDEWLDGITSMWTNNSRLITNFVIDRDNRIITIPNDENNLLSTGDNEFIIYSTSYQIASVTVNLSKENPLDLQAVRNDSGDIVITGLTESYAKALSGLRLNGTALYDNNAVGSDGTYEIVNTSLILKSSLFEGKEDTQFVLQMSASGYHDVRYVFTPSELEQNGEIRAEVPELVQLSDENTYIANKNVTIIVGKMLDTAYAEKISSVTVNGETVDKNLHTGMWKTDYVISGSYFAASGDYSIVIYADGYYDKEFTVTIPEGTVLDVPGGVGIIKSGRTVVSSLEIEPGSSITISVGESYGQEKIDYINAFESVVIILDGEEIKDYSRSEVLNGYYFWYYDFELNEFTESGSEYEVILKADGYADKVLTVTTTGDKADEEELSEPADYVGIASYETDNEGYDHKEIQEGSYIWIKIGDFWKQAESDAYKAAFEKVVIEKDGETFKTLKKSDLSIGHEYSFKLNLFAEAGEYTLTLVAEGYEDKELTLSVVGDPDIIDEDDELEDEDGKDVPAEVGIKQSGRVVDTTSISSGNSVRVQVRETFTKTEYFKNFESVSVYMDDQLVSSYKRSELSLGMFALEFTLNDFDEAGEYTIRLSADGFKTKVLTVTVTENQKALSNADTLASLLTDTPDEDITEETETKLPEYKPEQDAAKKEEVNDDTVTDEAAVEESDPDQDDTEEEDVTNAADADDDEEEAEEDEEPENKPEEDEITEPT